MQKPWSFDVRIGGKRYYAVIPERTTPIASAWIKDFSNYAEARDWAHQEAIAWRNKRQAYVVARNRRKADAARRRI